MEAFAAERVEAGGRESLGALAGVLMLAICSSSSMGAKRITVGSRETDWYLHWSLSKLCSWGCQSVQHCKQA